MMFVILSMVIFFEREHLLSRRDVLNIQRVEKHHSDHVSVSAGSLKCEK